MLSNDNIFSELFLDICRGYSTADYNNNIIYLKHFNIEEQIIIESSYKKYIDYAKSKGLPSKDIAIQRLIKNNLWSNEESELLKNIDNEIVQLQNNKKNHFLPSKIKEIDERIKGRRIERNKKESELNSLIQSCAEFYAQTKLNDVYIRLGFFSDKKLKNHLYDDIQFDDIDDKDIRELILIYNNKILSFSDDLIKKIALQDFCLNYFYLSDNVRDFFGRKIFKLTFFQLKLANYARYFKNVFENCEIDKIPTEIRKDPDKLIDYLNANKNMQKIMEKTSNTEANEKNKETLFSATSFVGAKKQDIETIQSDNNEKGPDIFELAKKNGGSLSLSDLMNLKR